MDDAEKVFRSVLAVFPESKRAVEGLQKLQHVFDAKTPEKLIPPQDKIQEIKIELDRYINTIAPTLPNHHVFYEDKTDKSTIKNLQQMFDLQIDHFSAYALTVEPNTKLNYLIKKKKIKPLSESKSENHFKILQEISSEIGYKQYEISNFCRKDKFALHNTSYWEDKIYLGIGPSAHSYNGESRRWNISNNLKYITFINSGEKYFDEEILSINQKYNEYTLTSLRTIWGISLDYLENNFDKMITSHFKKNSRKWIENENAILENNSLKLTNKGMLFADAISSDLFII